ncbi:MAG: hypothetical protein V7K90_23585 [Nostoc sp.]|uniref:hypothetical protein n=1 Tax=Nostoc sp. TaxID=1180 RepID=UPI002FF94099
MNCPYSVVLGKSHRRIFKKKWYYTTTLKDLCVHGRPPLLAAEPPGAAFPASGWKRGLGWGKTEAKNQVSKLFQTCVYTVAN